MKTNFTIILAYILFIFNGYAQDKKVAVVTFFSDKEINYSNADDTQKSLIQSISEIGFHPDFDLKPILHTFHNKFFNDYTKQLPFDIIPEEDITTNEDYIAFEPKWHKDKPLKRFEVYDGYKYVNAGFLGRRNAKALAEMLKSQADGILFVSINYTLNRRSKMLGTKTFKIKAYVRMVLFDKNGKKVFSLVESANSEDKLVLINGVSVIRPRKLLPLCKDALDQVMTDLDGRIGKITKNVAKKL